MELRYKIPYEVPATTRLEALFAVSNLLREGVVVERVAHCQPSSTPGYWDVLVAVREEAPEAVARVLESSDPITAAKAEADR